MHRGTHQSKGAVWTNLQQAWEDLSEETIAKGFINVAPNLGEIIRLKGGNFYETPHIPAADKLKRLRF